MAYHTSASYINQWHIQDFMRMGVLEERRVFLFCFRSWQRRRMTVLQERWVSRFCFQFPQRKIVPFVECGSRGTYPLLMIVTWFDFFVRTYTKSSHINTTTINLHVVRIEQSAYHRKMMCYIYLRLSLPFLHTHLLWYYEKKKPSVRFRTNILYRTWWVFLVRVEIEMTTDNLKLRFFKFFFFLNW